MDDLATDCRAIFEATVFLSYFNDLPDPRQQSFAINSGEFKVFAGITFGNFELHFGA